MALDLGELVYRVRVDDSDLDSGIDRSRSRFAGLGSAIGAVARVVGVAAVGAIGAAGAVGLRVAAQMEQAEIAFTTMLGSGRKARAFLGDLEAFAAKTPFEFPELQTAASSLVSAGIKAKDVIPIMTTLGDVTSGMGTGSEGIKRATIALQQMQAAGKITGEDLNQLRDAGIPVYDLLASATGRSKAEVVKLAQAGKLGKEDLQAMMGALKSGDGLERFTGLMAKQSVSLTGMWSTLKDTFSVGMADAIQPLLPLIKDGLGGATAFLAANLPKLGAGLATVVQHVRDWFAAQSGGKGLDIGATFDKVQAAAAKLWPQIQAGARELKGIGPIVSVTAAVFGFFAQHLDTLIKYMPLIVAGFVAVKVAQAAGNVVALARLPIEVANTAALFASASANRALAAQMLISNGVENVSMATRIRSTVATGASTVASLTAAAASKVWAAGQWLLNAALTANPIGIVVVAIGALVAGLIFAYRNSETFRNVVTKAMSAVQRGAGEAVGFMIDGFRMLLNVWLTVADGIISGAAKALGWIPGLGDKLKGANRAFDKMRTGIDQTLAGVAADARGWGNDVATGFAGGIDAASYKAVNAAGGMANRVAANAKYILGEASPSKVFAAIGRFVGEGFVEGLVGTESRITATIDALLSKVTDGTKDLGSKVTAGVRDAVRAARGELLSLANEAQTTFDAFKSMTAATTAAGALTGLGKGEDDAVSSGSIITDLQAQVATAQAFAANLMKLSALGLNKEAIASLAAQGAAQSAAAAQALVEGGRAAVTEVNKLEALLGSAGMSAARVGSAAMYDAGVESARGLAHGFRSQRHIIREEMEDIARTMQKAIRKALGIKSRSTVFAALGMEVPAGLALGIARGSGDVDRAVAGMVSPSLSVPVYTGSRPLGGDGAYGGGSSSLSLDGTSFEVQQRRTNQLLEQKLDRIAGLLDRTAPTPAVLVGV